MGKDLGHTWLLQEGYGDFQHIDCPSLPLITVGDYDLVTDMYPDHTGVGGDGIHPKVGKQLSVQANENIVGGAEPVRGFGVVGGCVEYLECSTERNWGGTGYWGYSPRGIAGGHAFGSF